MMSRNIMNKIFQKQNLTLQESEDLFVKILSGSFKDVEIAAILTGLKLKGESIEEIAGALTVLDKFKLKIEKNKSPSIDTCGTGGDGKNCINVSTAVAILLSSMGIPVVKHGNSAQSGKIGSADILKEFGIPSNMKKEEAEKYLRANNFVFLFAPFYHPAMKFVAPVRKILSTPTIFNYLGPFINPANPEIQITGINRRDALEKLSDALLKAGKFNIILYSSFDGYDEISTKAPTECYEIRENYIKKFIIEPENFFNPFPMPRVKDIKQAKDMFLEAIKGEDENLSRLVALNASLGIKYIKEVDSFKDAYNIALKQIMSGKVFEKFLSLQQKEKGGNRIP
jgi:anthranilate phosphoribosyltransferase